MGVTGLWPILAPTARPTPLPTLNRKRLAVDASIWIYQFLKAVRDKEGNALRNSHVVGFFRRICKLLFFGIKPVFVFDGGAPVLKRQTVLGRKQRREGRRDDAVRTAGRLLAVQMKKRGEEEEEKRRKDMEREKSGLNTHIEEEEPLPAPEDLVYVGEMGMSTAERATKREFHKKDAYHLPDVPDLAEMGQPNDPRIMSAEQLEEYAKQFHNGEDVNLYDFSNIDFDGDFFRSLPEGDRYNILNAARLRSRLRMGLSKVQLEEMFPDRMAFSKFQIERVRERNELTQRLMNLNGMNGDDLVGVGGGRIAGDQNREYVLVKNDGVEGGYALGVVSIDRSVGERNKPIDVETYHQKAVEQAEESDDEFEDVPIEGLNRLPKSKSTSGQNMTYKDHQAREYSNFRRHSDSSCNLPGSRNGENSTSRMIELEDPGSLFVDDGITGICQPDRVIDEEEEEDFNRAIALSLQNDVVPEEDLDEEKHLSRAVALSLQNNHNIVFESEDEDFEDVSMPDYKQQAVPEPTPLVNAPGRAIASVVNRRSNAAVPKRRRISISSGSETEMDLQMVMAKARKQKFPMKNKPALVVANTKNPWDGPLPFEKLDLGKSLFGKKAKVASLDGEQDEDLAGGFEREEAPRPLPPWMAGGRDIGNDIKEQQKLDKELNARDRELADQEDLAFRRNNEPINIDSDNESDVEILEGRPPKRAKLDTMGKISENIRASLSPVASPALESGKNVHIHPSAGQDEREEEEAVEWSESEYGDLTVAVVNSTVRDKAGSPKSLTESPVKPSARSKYPPPLLEDGSMPQKDSSTASGMNFESETPSMPKEEFSLQEKNANGPMALTEQERAEVDAEFDEFSDSEDEELLAQLAIEAEEHARFASTLNNKSQKENQEAYEKELKALRSQQKKDRRDADDVSHTMVTECQALLRLFGLPYITAPMEAEAQCAELVRLELVDGIVTDDSDIFLFGGTRVYKNMFNSNKFVECYLASDLEKELSLSRDQLISIAHLLGSDYTDGLAGIGPVTAIEILSEFPSNTGLQIFKDWWQEAQLSSAPLTSELTTFRKKFRRSQATKLFLPPSFPSHAVTEAYLKPEVDSSPDAFQWGVPDLDKLRDFLTATIGWTQERTDEVLVPVIRDMNRREVEGTQTNITRFFDGAVGAGVNTGRDGRPVGSKRMSAAVNRLKSKKRGGVLDGNTESFAQAARGWAEKNDLSYTAKEQAKVQKKRSGKGKGKVNMAMEEENTNRAAEAEDESDDVPVSARGKGKAVAGEKKRAKA
ncbi:DNA excision repair protein-like protein [Calycina marina]|uniref:DNA excision repair protein-like protein n=1 Tax=Calycina marina TaxID=1763456 RepID=A0A9P7ZBD6_9HELO|nr:DNA excision repair protein-like protein [Calycina marina]